MQSELKALAERVMALTGPCRETDALIRKAVYAPPTAHIEQSPLNGAWVIYNGTEFRSGRPAIWEGPGRSMAFTASLDAAMTLVPQGFYGMEVYSPGDASHKWAVYLLYDGAFYHGEGASFALALTAAALLALAEQVQQ